MLGGVSRVTLPSYYGKDALYVDIISPTTPAQSSVSSTCTWTRSGMPYTTAPSG